MPDNNALTERFVISMTPDEALDRAMGGNDADAGLVVAVMYQALIGALHDVLDEYEQEPEEAFLAIQDILFQLGADEKPTLN